LAGWLDILLLLGSERRIELFGIRNNYSIGGGSEEVCCRRIRRRRH